MSDEKIKRGLASLVVGEEYFDNIKDNFNATHKALEILYSRCESMKVKNINKEEISFAVRFIKKMSEKTGEYIQEFNRNIEEHLGGDEDEKEG